MRKGAGAYIERSSTHGPRIFRGPELIDPGLLGREHPAPLEQPPGSFFASSLMTSNPRACKVVRREGDLYRFTPAALTLR